MNLEEIEQQLKQIEQMLDKIDVEEIKGKEKEEIKKMAEDPINQTDQFIKQAVEKKALEECHFEKLVLIYQKAKQRLSEIDVSKVGRDQQDVITQITKKADAFEQQKKAYEKAKDEYDPQKTLDAEEKERDELQEEIKEETAIADGISVLNNRRKKQIKNFKEAYQKYLKAKEKANAADENIPEPEGEFKKEIDEIEQQIDNLKTDLLTDAQVYFLTVEIQQHEAELEKLEKEGIVGEKPNPLSNKSDDNKWDRRAFLQKELAEKKGKITSHEATNTKIEKLKAQQTKKISEWKNNYKEEHNKIAESQKKVMNTAINSMRKDLSKNKKYSEKFVTYMETIFDEAENNENYDGVNKVITREEKLREEVKQKKTVLESKKEKIATLQLGITQEQPKTVNASQVNRGKEESQTPIKGTSTETVALKKLTFWEKQRRTYEQMKEAQGKKGFRPILWFKSLSQKQIEAWEQGDLVKKNAPILSAEKVEKAKENIVSRRDAFAKSILYDVVQQTGSNIAVTEEMKQKAYNVAKDDGAR